jgi:hypothetical protein
MSDVADVMNALAGTLANDRGGLDIIKSLFNKHLTCPTPAFEADDNTQRVILFKNTTNHDLRLLSAEWTPDAAITASDTNYTIMNLYLTDTPASGTDKLAVTGRTTATGASNPTGNITAETPEALVVTTTEADRILAAGEYIVLFCDGATGGTGLDLPIGRMVLELEPV